MSLNHLFVRYYLTVVVYTENFISVQCQCLPVALTTSTSEDSCQFFYSVGITVLKIANDDN